MRELLDNWWVQRVVTWVLGGVLLTAVLWLAQRTGARGKPDVITCSPVYRAVMMVTLLASIGFAVFLDLEPDAREAMLGLAVVGLYVVLETMVARIALKDGRLVKRSLLGTSALLLSEIREIRWSDWWQTYLVVDQRGRKISIPIYMAGAREFVQHIQLQRKLESLARR